ncbi:MAG TPA: ATP-binding protein [Syntrophales bacterium]|nr:ATP-binding protein [Syntrophales bacterium]
MQTSAPLRNLLLVDDEPQILNSLRRELRQKGYCIYTAGSGPAGIDILLAHDIGVVLSDQMMPGMDGIAFLEHVRRLKPDVIRILLTAHGNFESALEAINRSHVSGYLTKPWRPEELQLCIERAFEHYELVTENRRLLRLTGEQNEQLRAGRDLLQSIIDSISDPILMLDGGLRVLMANRAASSTGIGKQVPGAGNPGIHDYLACRYGVSLADAVRASISNAEQASFQAEVMQEHFRMEGLSVYPMREWDHARPAAVLRIRDMTEEIRMERRRRQQEKLEALGRLVSGMHHQINNPCNFILFNMPLLRDSLHQIRPALDAYARANPGFEVSGMPYAEFREDIERMLLNIERGATRIHAVVSRLRGITERREPGMMSPIDPRRVVEKALDDCREQLRKTVATLDVCVDENLPACHSDPKTLERILTELLLNAAEAADKDPSTVRITVSGGRGWRERLIIDVADNGCGMSPETQARLFEPYFTTKAHGAGIGMGLFVCRDLISDLGGTISVQSAPGEGTTVRLTVPAMKTK